MMDKQLLNDIGIRLAHNELRPVYSIPTESSRGPAGKGKVIDMPRVSGRDNLGQAVVMRLLTPRGELASLGHPLYGSRRENTETIRNLARLYILESLQMEPRIKQVASVDVSASANKRSTVDICVQVVPIEGTDKITIGPITMEL